MAKVVSVTRKMVPTAQQRQDDDGQAPSSAIVSLTGLVLSLLLVLGAVAMVVMAFNYKP